MYAFSFSSFRLSNFDFQTAVDIISLRLGSPNRIEAPNTQPHKLVLCNSRKLLEFRASLKEMLNFDRRSILRILLGATAAQTARASTTVLRVGGASVEVSLDPQGFDLPQEALLDWVKSAALAVTGYYGRFPVPKAGVRIISAERKGGLGRQEFRKPWGAVLDLGGPFHHCRRSQGRLDAHARNGSFRLPVGS